MSESCPVPTPAERQVIDILNGAEQAMLATVYSALADARRRVVEELEAIGSQEAAPPAEYFAAVVHQKLFLRLCGADAETFEGGNPAIAAAILENGQKISDHYWAAKSAD